MTREEAIETLGHVVPFATQNGEKIAEAIDMAIEALQTEVVRCKDCRWYEQKQKHLPYNVSKRYCNRSCVLATKENDFCSYGERREP